ncbi:MAG: hypothetical protein HYT87_12375 [Nitrospirae bacterium]|nr:hypothetical protein [Nitrospirota bacterium]
MATPAILVCAISLSTCGGSAEEKAQLCLDQGDWDCVITESNNVLTGLGGSATPPADTEGYASWVNAKLNLATAFLGQAGFDMRKFLHAAVDIQKSKDPTKDAFDIIKKKVFGVDTSKSEDIWVPQLNTQIIKVFAAQKQLEELLYDKGSFDGRSGTAAVEVDDSGLPKLSDYDCGKATATSGTSSTTKTSTTTSTAATTGTTAKKQTGTGTTTTGATTGTTATTTSSSGAKLCRSFPTGTTDQTRYLIGDGEFLFGAVLLTRTIMQASLMGLDTVLSSSDVSAAIKKAALCLQYEASYAEFEPFGTSKRYTLQNALADITGAFSYVINSDPALSDSSIKTTFDSIKTSISDTKSKAIDPAIESACTQIDGIATQAETQLKTLTSSGALAGATVACTKDTGNISCSVSVSQTLPAPLSTAVTVKITLPITVGDPKKDCKDELKEAFGPTGIDKFLCKVDDDGDGNLDLLSAATPRVCDKVSTSCPTAVSTDINPTTVLGQDVKTLLASSGLVDVDAQLKDLSSKFNTIVSEGLATVKKTLDEAFGKPVTRGGKLPAGVGTKVTATTSTTSTTSTSSTTTGSTK